MRCFDPLAAEAMVAEIKAAMKVGDSLGGIAEVLAFNVPVGLGSHVHWDRKLDGLLAQALMSIHAVKGVEIGDGFELAQPARLGRPRRHLLGRGRARLRPRDRARRRHRGRDLPRRADRRQGGDEAARDARIVR